MLSPQRKPVTGLILRDFLTDGTLPRIPKFGYL